MIVVMKAGSSAEELRLVEEKLTSAGLEPHVIRGTERSVVAAVGDERVLEVEVLEALPGVEKVLRVLAPYKLASREAHAGGSVVKAGPLEVGGRRIAVIAGPCTVEGRSQILETAHAVKEAGASALRGGAFKPRTSPYSFQGLHLAGLELLAEARERTGLPIVTEVMTAEHVPLVAEFADVLQIGTRNMHNFHLLKAAGRAEKPVLLKRGMSARMDELLLAAEYVLREGNPAVILCERGIRTFEEHTRNTLSLSAVPFIKQNSHLPVMVDPSHGCGVRSLVEPMGLAAVAAGADGLLVEVAPDPARALVDGEQTLSIAEFKGMMARVGAVAKAVGREA